MPSDTPLLIEPRLHAPRDGVFLRGLLPDRLQRNVGPFAFFDRAGPNDLLPRRSLDRRALRLSPAYSETDFIALPAR